MVFFNAMNYDAISLLKEAREAMRNAYNPYSGYAVGAALLAEDGKVFCGCNVENASYGLTVCAERSAVFAAVGAGCRRFRAMAVVAGNSIRPSPCGACRQVLAEFADPGFPIHVALAGDIENFRTFELGHLLPETFRMHELKN